ncbi:MAG: glycosyl hydrolase family 18 protein [Lachnospiraceae bacterium]|nr:glycosyl hydrolase family 18 protein [Lachnospiraceae bacterium]
MKKKILPAAIIVGLIILILGIIGISSLIRKYTPTKKTEDLNKYFNISSEDESALIVDNTVSDSKAKLIDGKIYVDYNFVHDSLNSRFYWDANENVLLYTTAADIVSAAADSSTYTVTKQANDFGYPIVKATSSSALIALDYVKQFSNITYKSYDKPSRTVITTSWGKIETASTAKSTQLRVKGGIKSPILKQVKKGESLTILEKGTKWDKAASKDGIVGYIKASTLSDIKTTELKNNDYTEEAFTHIKKDKDICLAWHQITNKSSNSKVANVISSTKGVNVMSPTWFYLNDNNGGLADLASKDYVNYCHSQGIEVWGLFSNLENKNVDAASVLTHTSTRTTLINQIMSAAFNYELDGVNIDFENITKEAYGDSYIEFIRELAIKCHNNGISLSVDVTVPASYNKFFNRADMANFADYVIIMGYDEHYNGSDAGSVASLPWVTTGLNDTLKEVPADQVILGMPLYTRIWELTPKDADNPVTDTADQSQYNITSSVYGMDAAAAQVSGNNATASPDEETGQNYAEWNANNKLYKVWLEDNTSLEKRLELVDKNKLAGAAFWKLGFENSSIWDIVIKYLD